MILEILKNIAIVIGGAVVMSLLGVAALLGLDLAIEKWKGKKKDER